MMSRAGNFLKLAVFVVIVLASFYLIRMQDVTAFADRSIAFKLSMSMLSGVFYTSFVFAPLSVVLFVILAKSTGSIFLIALMGGLGAVAGDLLIVKFFRTIFKAFSLVTHQDFFRKIKKGLRKYHLDLISMVVGMVIVASPFPDELGLILLGASSLSYFKLAILTFILNSAGILIILLSTRILT